MTKPILPAPADIIGPAQVTLVQNRPGAFDHVNWGVGNYANIFAGFDAQVKVAIARLADGVIGSGLRGSGDQLKAYVASEFQLPPNLGRTQAVGTMILDRTASTNPKLAGVILKGRKVQRQAESLATVPITACSYEVAADVQVSLNQNLVSVPIIAVSDGAAYNTPSNLTYKSLTFADKPFDPSFAITAYDAGGGSDGLTDADIVRYAQAFSPGQLGPTTRSLRLAALSAPGVKHILIQDPSPDGATVYIADASWGSSGAWINVVQQSIYDSDYIGYATKIRVAPIPNTPILVSITVRLRNPNFLSDTSEIDDAIRSAISSYFDDRPDFNVYGPQPLRAVVSKAHKRILRCTSATITDLSGNPLTYSSPFYGHLYLANNAISFSYLGPV